MASGDEGIRFTAEADALEGLHRVISTFEAREALDEPYVIEVDMAIDDRDFDPTSLLGKDFRLILERSDRARRLLGLVRSVREGVLGEAGQQVRVEVVPALWMLSLRRNTRMFQEQSVPDIVQAVLEEGLGVYDRSVKLELEGSYPTREYCMQYQETDLEFVQRLLGEEGIHYGFDHEGEVEEMVLRDSNDAFAEAPGADGGVVFQAHDARIVDVEPVHRLDLTYGHAETSVVARDFDWTTPGFLVEDEERGEDELGRDRESYEHGAGKTLTLWDYDAGARRYQQRDAPQQKALRLEQHARDTLTGRGVGRLIGFAPGTTFELTGHPTVGVDGEYVITRVVHHDRPFRGVSERYHNTFECIPLDVPYRSRRRAPKPSIPGVQTAVVTGPSGEEIHTDEHGRIKVQFHWDRENPADETSSVWVRCEQAWAGPGWGFWWLPRIGMEVLVHFRDGDPDRPIVTGCLYNADNPTPYALPDEKTKSTIKSQSSPNAEGFNELRFEDKAGSEEIYTHAQKDYNEVVENDHTTTVHHDQKIEVDNDQTQSIGVDQTETVHGNQDLSVGANRTVHVKGDFDETVDGTETRNVTGDVSETFGANETRTIGAAVDEDIGTDETRNVGGNQKETIGASHSLEVGAARTVTIAGTLSEQIGASISETTPAAYNLTAVGGLTATLGGNFTVSAPAGVMLVSPGGITWVDSNDCWFGGLNWKYSPFEQKNYTLKFEIGSLANGINMVKIEQAGLELCNDGFDAIKGAFTMITAGAKAEGGAADKMAAAFASLGG